MTQTPITKNTVIDLVLKKLQEHGKDLGGDFQFRTVEGTVREDEGLWHVPVRPDHRIVKRGQFYDVLNEIEDEIKTQNNLDVLIVPVSPEQ